MLMWTFRHVLVCVKHAQFRALQLRIEHKTWLLSVSGVNFTIFLATEAEKYLALQLRIRKVPVPKFCPQINCHV
jgi:hypothetical protein